VQSDGADRGATVSIHLPASPEETAELPAPAEPVASEAEPSKVVAVAAGAQE
jgi:hypothetical protein